MPLLTLSGCKEDGITDADGDGYSVDEDCDDNDATSQTVFTDPECDGFYLAENQITVRCPGAAIDASGEINGVVYHRRERDYLLSLSTAVLSDSR